LSAHLEDTVCDMGDFNSRLTRSPVTVYLWPVRVTGSSDHEIWFSLLSCQSKGISNLVRVVFGRTSETCRECERINLNVIFIFNIISAEAIQLSMLSSSDEVKNLILNALLEG
jgi:hypothetical protein